MAIEIEKKYRLSKKRLVELSASSANSGASSEVRFSRRITFIAAASSTKRSGPSASEDRRHDVLTYKESVQNDSDFKHQIEFETTVADVDATENIIEKLGYKLSVVYEKHRKTGILAMSRSCSTSCRSALYGDRRRRWKISAKPKNCSRSKTFEPEPRGYPRLTVKYGKLVGDVSEARFEESRGTD